jgi:hypothetical protein
MLHTPPGHRSTKRSHQLQADVVGDGTATVTRQLEIQIEPDGQIYAMGSGPEAVQASAAILDAHIRTQAVLKLGLYGLAALFGIMSAALVVITPDGREALCALLSTASFAIAVGCAGFGAFAIKMPLLSAKAGKAPKRVSPRFPR